MLRVRDVNIAPGIAMKPTPVIKAWNTLTPKASGSIRIDPRTRTSNETEARRAIKRGDLNAFQLGANCCAYPRKRFTTSSAAIRPTERIPELCQ